MKVKVYSKEILMDPKMREALLKLRKAFAKVNELYLKSNLDILPNDSSYPFELSFDEVTLEVIDWVDGFNYKPETGRRN
jgi:hypothetical protein